MGEAKQNKLKAMSNPASTNESSDHGLTASLAVIDKDHFAAAVKQVVSAVTSFAGADCILYSVVGAGLLNKLGLKSVPVAGSAAWRVGPGDADAISHATEVTGQHFAPEGKSAGLFHCWIQTVTDANFTHAIGFDIIDTSTWQLKKKARELDAMDGQVTKVDFCPEYIWDNAKSKKLLSPRAVVSSFDVGVYAYLRKPEIEKIIFTEGALQEAEHMIAAAEMCYKALLRGEALNVMGVGANGVEEADPDAPMKLRKVSLRP